MRHSNQHIKWNIKNKLLPISLFCFGNIFFLSAQIDGNLLLQLTNATTIEMNAIASPKTGTLLYNTTEKWVYQYNGTAWEKLAPKFLPLVLTKTANYTLTPADNGNVLTFNSATDVTLTAPTGLPIGFNISVYQIGDGQIIFNGAAGVTLKNRLSRFKTAGKDAGVGILCTATNIFHLTGDLKSN